MYINNTIYRKLSILLEKYKYIFSRNIFIDNYFRKKINIYRYYDYIDYSITICYFYRNKKMEHIFICNKFLYGTNYL